jgi:cold shock CspA family protein
MNGVVSKIVESKGYGFVRGEDGHEYFFHREDFNGHFVDLEEDVRLGRKIEVTFNVVPSQKGPRASGVQRVDDGV